MSEILHDVGWGVILIISVNLSISVFSTIRNRSLSYLDPMIESLLDSNEEDNKPPEPAKPKYYKTKPKNFDLYDSLISTYLISELCGQDVLDD